MTPTQADIAPGFRASAALSRLLHVGLIAVTVAFYLLVVMVSVGATHHRIAPGGAPLFYDFDAFYEAGRFALRGDAAAAYDDAKMIAAEHRSFPGMTVRLPWNYPPSLQLIVAPLGALPYVAAWLVWSLAGYLAFLHAVQRVSRTHWAPLWLLAPAAAINLFFGQNALFSLAIVVSGVSHLERRPILAGCLLGLLACKPQFAVAPVVLLAVGRHWRALGAAAASQAALAAASALVLGPATWVEFVGRLSHPGSVFTSSSSDWRAIPSILTLARTLGLPDSIATAAHWLVAAGVVLLALRLWRRTTDPGYRAAITGTACVLITPYLRGYDLALLLPAVIVLSEAGLDRGQRLPSAILLAAAGLGWAAPALLMFTSPAVQLGPLISLAILGCLAWRLLGQPEPVGVTPNRRPT